MEKRWFIYDPAGTVVLWFDNKEEMEKAAPGFIRDNHLDDQWSEEVFHVVGGYGVLPDMPKRGDCWEDFDDAVESCQTHKVSETVLDKAENYPDEDGEEWPYCSDWDYIATYDLEEITK